MEMLNHARILPQINNTINAAGLNELSFSSILVWAKQILILWLGKWLKGVYCVIVAAASRSGSVIKSNKKNLHPSSAMS